MSIARFPDGRPVSDSRAALLAGAAQGALLSSAWAVVGWFFIGPELYSPLNLAVVVGAMPLAAVAAWCAGYAVLRGCRVARPADLSWWTLGGTAVCGGLVALVVGVLAFLLSIFTVVVLWTGDRIEPIVIGAVTATSVETVLIGMIVSLSASRALRPRLPAPLL